MSKHHKINIPSTRGSISASANSGNTMSQGHQINPSIPRSLKLPCTDILKGTREDFTKICLPLYEASLTSDWQAAKALIDKRPELVRYAITNRYDTALHVAASTEATKLGEDFLENLVNMMEKEDLELENLGGDNALMLVAGYGSTKMVDILLNKHKLLVTIVPSDKEKFPLAISAYWGKHEMTKYLYDVCDKMGSWYFTNVDRIVTLTRCVRADMFEMASQILTDYPKLITQPAHSAYILHALAGKVDALNRTEPNIIWKTFSSIFAKPHTKKRLSEENLPALNLLKKVLNMSVKFTELDMVNKLIQENEDDEVGEDASLSGTLFFAAKIGNTRLIIELIRAYPSLLWVTNDHGHTVFHIAIMHRHQGIYNLLYEIGSSKFTITGVLDKKDNSILHLIGMTSKEVQLQTKSSLLMQRDLLWFQDVEKMLPADLRELKNKSGHTAYQLFFENNKDLVSGGLNWIKDSMVVATLIVTVAFAVAFTLPGGYNQDNGFPIFIHEPTFLVFIIADAISLFSSSTSLLVFLSILTSRHGQRDFVHSLPSKLMIGLVTLFISVAAMMLTFVASFFMLYRHEMKWVPIVISIFAATPVIAFAALQFPLWLDMFRSMYDSRYIFHPKRRMLYN